MMSRAGGALQERVLIRASIDEVWSVVSNPELLPRWNPKAVRVMPDSLSAPGPGYRFRVTQRFGRRVDTRQTEIVTWNPPNELQMRITGGSMPAGAEVIEAWILESRDGATMVKQTVDLSRSGIAWAWRVAIAILNRIGKPAAGDRYLDVMRELIEGGHLPGRADGNAPPVSTV